MTAPAEATRYRERLHGNQYVFTPFPEDFNGDLRSNDVSQIDLHKATTSTDLDGREYTPIKYWEDRGEGFEVGITETALHPRLLFTEGEIRYELGQDSPSSLDDMLGTPAGRRIAFQLLGIAIERMRMGNNPAQHPNHSE